MKAERMVIKKMLPANIKKAIEDAAIRKYSQVFRRFIYMQGAELWAERYSKVVDILYGLKCSVGGCKCCKDRDAAIKDGMKDILKD